MGQDVRVDSNPGDNPRPQSTRPRPRPRPLSPQVSQQLLQVPTRSSKAPSTTACLEAGTTHTRPTHSRSPAGTHSAPFPTPEPAPGTPGYPPTVPEAPCLYAPFVLSRSWLPTSSPRSVEAAERGCCRRSPGTRELSPRPGDVGTHRGGGQGCSTHDESMPRGETSTRRHAHTCGYIQPEDTHKLYSYVSTLSPWQGSGTQLGGLSKN